MPELPEVETVARQLDTVLRGRLVRGLRIADAKLRRPGLGSARVAGRRVGRVFRAGKQVALALEAEGAPTLYLLVHLRMTGRLLWQPEGRAPVGRRARARLGFDQGALYFVDARRFGTMELTGDPERALAPGAVEPLSPACTRRWLAGALARSAQPLKVWLLRQDRLVGLGNIYASEICFEAGLSPERRTDSLMPGEVAALHRAIRSVLRRAIRFCGVTFSDFQDSNGDSGAFQKYLKVYGRAGRPCRRCGQPLRRIVQAQRSTYFCPCCQPAEAPSA